MVDFEYTRSPAAPGHHFVGVFDAFVGSRREIWVRGEGSGLTRDKGLGAMARAAHLMVRGSSHVVEGVPG